MEKFYKLNNKSLGAYKVKTHKELWTKLKKKGFSGISADVFTSVKQEKDTNSFNAVFSTAKEDRHGDIVQQSFDLKSFKKNPVLLDSHDYRSIESIVGKVKAIKVKDGKLVGKIVFARENPRGELAYNLTKGGFINTTSIGFIPKEFNEKGNILKSELLEISAVSVPANPEALIEKLNGQSAKKTIKDKNTDKKNAKNECNGSKNVGEKDNEKDKKHARAKASKIVKKEFENWDNGDNEIRVKLKDVDAVEDGSITRTIFKKTNPRIEANMGRIKGGDQMVIQSMFFLKSDGWTMDDAVKWFSQRQADLINPIKQEMKEEKNIDVIKRVLKQKELKRKESLQKIYSAITLISKNKVDVTDKDIKSENSRTINRAIRTLLKIKQD